jgi:hypothetical protein
MRMNMFVVYDNAKPYIEYIRGLNLVVAKLATKLPLEHETRKIGIICFAEPVLTEDCI